MTFQPNYQNIVKAAYNQAPERTPFYEHIIAPEMMEQIQGAGFKELLAGGFADKREYFRQYARFFEEMGYDTVSFEQCITRILPGAGALYGHAQPVIEDREDFEKYPWEGLPDIFFNAFEEDYRALGEMMPSGMKAIGGPGNGLFEIVQDLCGYEGLCYISADDPELYAGLFLKAGELMKRIWERFLERFAHIYCVCRFGDDLGFKTQTLLPEEHIRQHIIPRYAEIVEVVHRYNRPFLLHSCGNIFPVMEDIISAAGIDAKHSNEDGIAPFTEWVEKYGDRIGNFGGVDTSILCTLNKEGIDDYVTGIYRACVGRGGFALGSGNSIPDYVPPEGYLQMIETGRRLRGE